MMVLNHFILFYTKSKEFKDHHFPPSICWGLINENNSIWSLIGGQVLYHLGMPAIFLSLQIFVKCWIFSFQNETSGREELNHLKV